MSAIIINITPDSRVKQYRDGNARVTLNNEVTPDTIQRQQHKIPYLRKHKIVKQW